MAFHSPQQSANLGSDVIPVLGALGIAASATFFIVKQWILRNREIDTELKDRDNDRTREPFFLHLSDLLPGAKK